jgi:KaiC/GvpD/RAD55 family RecA-like ATPase
MKKLKSGIYGLNQLLDGGLNEHSATVIIGAAGTGKTTCAIQFIRRGLELKQLGIFVSLDENRDQIIREAVAMGWGEINDYIEDEKLIFIDASGRDFASFIREELPSFVEKWKGSDTRVVIDPLTPVIWSVDDRYAQRELLSIMLKETRNIGTVLCTLEEHSSSGNLSGNEVVTPMYLADCVIHIRHADAEDPASGILRIMKCRNSRHSKLAHRYKIVRGFGLMVQPRPYYRKRSREIPEKIAGELKNRSDLSKPTINKLETLLRELSDGDLDGVDAQLVLSNILDEYGD